MQSLREKIYIHEEIKSKATLDKQTNGDLRLMVTDRFGFKEYRIFKNEKRLDKYLSENTTIDIWKIKDNRESERAKTIYKYDNGEEIDTYYDKKNLYNTISSLSEHGIFSIMDENKKTKYFQKKSGWFYRNFEKIDKDEAEKNFLEKERLNAIWLKVYTFGLIALASGSILSAAKEKFSKAWDNKARMFSINLQNNLLPTLTNTISSNQLLTTVLTATLYRQNTIPTAALMIALSLKPTPIVAKQTQAKLCQPHLVSSVTTSSAAMDVAILDNNYVCVSTYDFDTPNSNYTALDILKIDDPANPVFVSAVNRMGGYYLAVSDHYAYVIIEFALAVINVKDPLNPKFVVKYGMNLPMGITISDHHAYVGNEDENENGILTIVNVTDPSKPTGVSSCPGVGTCNAIVVSGKYAYVATDEGLKIIDLTNLLKPTIVGSYPIPGEASDIAISDDKKFVFIADVSTGLQIINVEDPSHPTFVSSYYIPNGAGCLALLNDYVYMGDFNNNVQIINVADPSKPVFAGSLFVPSSNPGFSGIAVLKDYAFLTDYNSGLRIVKLNCPSSKKTATSLSTKLIIGGAIGGGVLLYVVATGTAIFCIIKKRKKSLSAKNEKKSLLVSS